MLVQCRDCDNQYDDRAQRRCPGCGSFLSNPVADYSEPADLTHSDNSEAVLFDRDEARAINSRR